MPEPKSERGRPRMGDASTEREAGARAATKQQQPTPPETPEPSGGGKEGALEGGLEVLRCCSDGWQDSLRRGKLLWPGAMLGC